MAANTAAGRRAMKLWLLPVFVFAIGATTTWAQSGRATVRGLIVDESGAVVSDVEVTATHVETNVVASTRSSDAGLYSLVNLPIGRYTLTFKKEGFATQTREGVNLGVAQVITEDIVLAIGALSDVITVSADAKILESGNAEIGTTMQSGIVEELPLTITGGRALENFAYALTPSVEGDWWESRIAGGATFSKEVVIDGTSAVAQIGGHIGEGSPPIEAVQEFKVQTSGIQAEYGRTGGGVFNFSLKSGTNELHGTGYGYLRNKTFNANTWQNNFLGIAKAKDDQKVGGGSVGGPIVRNKTFFFFATEEYQQKRFGLGGFDRTVPLPAFLDGNFSALLDTSTLLGRDGAGNPIYRGAIFDPRTGNVFPGNVIPQDRLSPISRKIADIYRAAYAPMVNRVRDNNAAPAHENPLFKQHQVSLKLDHALSDRNKLTGSFFWSARPRHWNGGIWDPSDEKGGPLSQSGFQEVGARQLRLSHNFTLGQSAVNVANFTFSRYINPGGPHTAGEGWGGKLGIPGITQDWFPSISFGDAVNGVRTTSIGEGGPGRYIGDTWIFSDSLSWVKGRHTFKFGGEVRHIVMAVPENPASIRFVFDNDQTGMPGTSWSNQVGSGFASMMLGEVKEAELSQPLELHGSRNYFASYVQNDIRVNSKLTVNLGVRWEITGPWTERNGRWANYDLAAISSLTRLPGTIVYATDANTTFEGKRDYSQFGPRAGLAYLLSPRVVLRGSYGIFYSPIGSNYWSGVPYGYAPGFRPLNRVDQVGGGAAAFNWIDGYPGQTISGNKDPDQIIWGQVTQSRDALKAGRIQQWNAGMDFELTRNTVFGVNYLGNKGSRLQSGELQRNQPDMTALGNLLRSGHEWDWVYDEASAAAAGVPYPYPGFSNFSFFALQPYVRASEGWGPVFFVGSPLGGSDYHALQLTLNQRMSRGLAAAMSYTLSRARTNVDTAFQETWSPGFLQDVNKLAEEAKVIDSQDRTHVLKGYVAWELPFGKGRRFISDASGLKDLLLGGWTLSTMFRYESGRPLRILSDQYYAGWSDFGYPIYVNANPNGNYSSRFNGNFDQQNPANNQYFDSALFSSPEYGDFGKGPGYFKQLRGFGRAYEDVGATKDVRIAGRYTLQIRFDLLNVFNRHYLADPVTDIGSPDFGRVTSLAAATNFGTGSTPSRQGQLGIRFTF